MTITAQHTTWLKFHVFQAKIEKKYTPVLKKEINTQITIFNTYAKEVGYPQAASKIDDLFNAAPIMTIVNDIHAESGGKYGYSVYKEFATLKRSSISVNNKGQLHKTFHVAHALSTKRVGLFGVSDEIAKQIIAELRLSLLNNVHGITDSIKQDILYYIQQGQINGWAYDKTAKEIQDKVGSTYRSQRIVRTESVKASNMGAMIGAEKTGLLMDKVWINAKDKRVRGNPLGKPSNFDHWDVGGQVVPMDATFTLGSRITGGATDFLRFPGDPKGQPGNIINCRCTIGFIPRRDENGVPIRVRPRTENLLRVA
jgi:hypothetical protein